jgi:hypothetical protein
VVKWVVIVALAACSSVELKPAVVRSNAGPASTRSIQRVVALPATCGTLAMETLPASSPSEAVVVPKMCDQEAVASADRSIRLALASRGYEVIDSHDITLVPREVIEEPHDTTFVPRDAEAPDNAPLVPRDAEEGHDTPFVPRDAGEAPDDDVVESVARFEHAPPNEQAAILIDLRADAVLSTRIWIGSSIGMSGRHEVIAQVQLLGVPDRALVWARRCELEVGSAFATESDDIERVARCVMEDAK